MASLLAKRKNGPRCIPDRWRYDGSNECGDHGDDIDSPNLLLQVSF